MIQHLQVHTYLLYAIVGCAVCVALESKFRESVVLALGRTYFSLIQGTWFWQIGFILYPPAGMAHWDEEDHVQMMQVTTIFSWHFAIAGGIVLLATLIINCMVKREVGADDRNGIEYQKIGLNSMKLNETVRTDKAPNGSALRHAFSDTSEDEV